MLASTELADLAKLYSEGGMGRLASLQKVGALSAGEAKVLNALPQLNPDLKRIFCEICSNNSAALKILAWNHFTVQTNITRP